jgi:hypothetical protein
VIQFLRLLLIVLLISTRSAGSRSLENVSIRPPTFKSITVKSLGQFYGIQA